MSLTYYIVAKKGVCIKCKEWEYLKTKECSFDRYISHTHFEIFNCVIVYVRNRTYCSANLSHLSINYDGSGQFEAKYPSHFSSDL